MPHGSRSAHALRSLRAAAYEIPTDAPESDGTDAWSSTTLVLVEARAGDAAGIGYTYADASIVRLIDHGLSVAAEGHDAFDIPAIHAVLFARVRNLGRPGLAATAISAIDAALWDLKGKLLDVPVVALLGRARDGVPIYGSGGFTSYSNRQLREQLAGWVERDGCRFVKMKVGTDADADPDRVRAARSAIGDRALFVDANGGYALKQALDLALRFADEGVIWFEEPVPSDDIAGLRLMRERAPAGMAIAAGEYGYVPDDFRRLLEGQALDVLQADASRCGGITGFQRVAALAEPFHTDISGHCAPALHLHVAMAAPKLRHLEWFHDHVRIEAMLFDGAPVPRDGMIRPDFSRPGLGLDFRHQDAERYRVA